MKAIISTTYDDRYMYFIPICVWAWNKLGVDVICFMPHLDANYDNNKKFDLLMKVKKDKGLRFYCHEFNAPEHKEATYAQCSRLYGACLDLPEDEVLIVSDIDMALFQVPSHMGDHEVFEIFGYDLVPDNQYPMCYISAPVKQWRRAICHTKTYQENLDLLLGDIESLHFRGNFWSKDQETAYNLLKGAGTKVLTKRAKEGTQFATLRYDRDDSFILDRLNPDTIDFHMNRPGYEDKNFQIILTILQYHYPQEDFGWLVSYNEEYKKLLL